MFTSLACRDCRAYLVHVTIPLPAQGLKVLACDHVHAGLDRTYPATLSQMVFSVVMFHIFRDSDFAALTWSVQPVYQAVCMVSLYTRHGRGCISITRVP